LLKIQYAENCPRAFHDNKKDDYQGKGGTNKSRNKARHPANYNRHEHGNEDSNGKDLA
jgi:hypothetical protein